MGKARASGRAGSAERSLVYGLHGRPVCRRLVIPALNVLDDFKRDGLAIEVDFSMPSERVVRVLNQVIGRRGSHWPFA